MLRKNKIVLVLLLAILCVSIGTVCATDVDNSPESVGVADVDISANPNEQIIVKEAKIND